MQYTLTIRTTDDNEWAAVMGILTAMQVTNVVIDEIDSVIMISANPVTLARIISVIAGSVEEGE